MHAPRTPRLSPSGAGGHRRSQPGVAAGKAAYGRHRGRHDRATLAAGRLADRASYRGSTRRSPPQRGKRLAGWQTKMPARDAKCGRFVGAARWQCQKLNDAAYGPVGRDRGLRPPADEIMPPTSISPALPGVRLVRKAAEPTDGPFSTEHRLPSRRRVIFVLLRS